MRFDNVILHRGQFIFKADAELPDDGIIGIAGANGSGKSTFMDLATSTIVPDQGSILYGNKDLLTVKTQERTSYFLGLYSGEEPVPGLTGFEYLEILTSSKEAARNAFDTFPEIQGFENRDISQLSRGQWVALLLASVMVSPPASTFIDEYMLFLDPRQRDIWTERLKTRSFRHPVFIITHDREFLREKCDQLIGFKAGEMISEPDLALLYEVKRDLI